jgi:protein O-GlcNAc transferase
MPKKEHLARLKLADLALDTRLVGGHITTSDALWAGVPVVTMIGRHFISRAPASILTHVGLSDLVTETPEEYLNLAVTLGMNRTLTVMIREKLKKNRATAPLFDSKRFVKNFEKGLMTMWETFMKGKGPEQIRVNEE